MGNYNLCYLLPILSLLWACVKAQEECLGKWQLSNLIQCNQSHQLVANTLYLD